MDSNTVPLAQAPYTHALQARIAACQRLAAGADSSADVQIALVLGDLDLAAVVRGLLAACENAEADVLRQWSANFTKIVVLVGNPDKLRHRFRALPFVIEGKVAVVGPAPAAELSSLRRLLRPLQIGAASEQVSNVVVALDDAAPLAVELIIASGRISVGEFLVSLSHTVSEGKLLGHFGQASALSIRPVADVDRLSEHDVYARVHHTSHSDANLRIHTRLRSVARARASQPELRS